jgi:hypothetical protein
VKVTKDLASRFFASGYSNPFSARGMETEVEPVHTAIADSEAPATRQDLGEKAPGRRKTHLGPPEGQERRKQDRRQRQVRVLLDTRVAQSRQTRSINEKA